MGIQTTRSILRSLPDARAGFAVSACSLGMPHARACGEARRHRRLRAKPSTASGTKLMRDFRTRSCLLYPRKRTLIVSPPPNQNMPAPSAAADRFCPLRLEVQFSPGRAHRLGPRQPTPSRLVAPQGTHGPGINPNYDFGQDEPLLPGWRIPRIISTV
jgi:hypothetical protein